MHLAAPVYARACLSMPVPPAVMTLPLRQQLGYTCRAGMLIHTTCHVNKTPVNRLFSPGFMRKYAHVREMEASSWETVYSIVFTENPEKPLETDRYVSYRINLTFSELCQYLLAHLVTFILLNENIKAQNCQCSSYKDNIRS